LINPAKIAQSLVLAILLPLGIGLRPVTIARIKPLLDWLPGVQIDHVWINVANHRSVPRLSPLG
jgi:hypothetical protein